MIKICLRCKKEFETNKSIKKYCSNLCCCTQNIERNKDKQRERYRKWRKENREKSNKYARDRYKNPLNLEKRRSRYYATYYLKETLLKKFDHHCLDCSSKDNLEVHHLKYSFNFDDCIIVCKKCHAKRHKIIYK